MQIEYKDSPHNRKKLKGRMLDTKREFIDEMYSFINVKFLHKCFLVNLAIFLKFLGKKTFVKIRRFIRTVNKFRKKRVI